MEAVLNTSHSGGPKSAPFVLTGPFWQWFSKRWTRKVEKRRCGNEANLCFSSRFSVTKEFLFLCHCLWNTNSMNTEPFPNSQGQHTDKCIKLSVSESLALRAAVTHPWRQGQTRFLLIGPLRWIRVKKHWMIGACKYIYVGFILEQFDCKLIENQLCSHFGYYYLQ